MHPTADVHVPVHTLNHGAVFNPLKFLANAPPPPPK